MSIDIERLGEGRIGDIDFSVPKSKFYLITLLMIVTVIAIAPFSFDFIVQLDENTHLLILEDKDVIIPNDDYTSLDFYEVIDLANEYFIIYSIFFIVLFSLVLFLIIIILKEAFRLPVTPRIRFPSSSRFGREVIYLLIGILGIIGLIALEASTVYGIISSMNSIEVVEAVSHGVTWGSGIIWESSDYEIFEAAASTASPMVVFRMLSLLAGGFLYLIVLHYSIILIKRNKAHAILTDSGIYLPKYCLHRDAAGKSKTLKDWRYIPFEQIKDVRVGQSTEFYSASKYLGSTYLGGGVYEDRHLESRYSMTWFWIILQTTSKGDFGLPVGTDLLKRKTLSNEYIDRTDLERFNRLRIDITEASQFLDKLSAKVTSAKLRKKIQQIESTFKEGSSPSTIV